MGIISLEKTNHLFWLGRYTERVFTTAKTFLVCYDKMIDGDETLYRGICSALAIPDVYGSREAFLQKYLFDAKNADSVYTNLTRAFDNAVVLRDEISSQTLSYIQLALTTMEKAKDSATPLMDLESVLDDLFAFWGSADDNVLSEDCRCIMKCGKYIERLDLYIALGYSREAIVHEFQKLDYRLHSTDYPINEAACSRFKRAILRDEDLHPDVEVLNHIFEVD